MKTNKLYCGDNLEIMKTLDSNSIQLIYLDPQYFSQADYGEFNDKWKDLKEYLDFMKLRLIECKRILSDKGSIYLHCDWHASHYLKILMDEVFGYENFRNEIVWAYRTGGISKKWFGRKHDAIFLYSKSKKYMFNPIEIKEYYKNTNGENFKPGLPDRNGGKDNGGYYRISFLPDVWQIPAVFNLAKEHLGYPTQKPIKLLERIIIASSNPGDIVLDCFCGSGTTCEAALKSGRKYIGIDINKNAIDIASKRLINR